MKKSVLFMLAFVVCALGLHAQDSLSNQHSLNFPTNHYGISIGNSRVFNGIRLNFAESNVKTINGINITCCAKSNKNTEAVVNGVSVGVLPSGGTFRFINIGLLGVGAHHSIKGVTCAGVVIGSSGSLKGFSASGIVTISDTISGAAVAGLLVGSQKANGIIVSGLSVLSEGDIKGVALTPGYLRSDKLNGFAVAGYNNINQTKGITVAIINTTKSLHGIQLGLINYAANNPKWLRVLPLINLHF
ncbi:MAG: hypothetical protein WCO54_11570 [Bacteroidota bacterium]